MIFAEAIAEKISEKNLPKNIFFNADMGCGKTVFTKGVAKFFKINEEITSPTFAFYNSYEIENSIFLNFFHWDIHRITEKHDMVIKELEEQLLDEKSIVVLEWSENLKIKSKFQFIEVKINFIDESVREIKVI